ncbi:nuclear transport factor 2 family protein [bacterium]|nr:nuclear transport factor 2 family protein [bacterium]
MKLKKREIKALLEQWNLAWENYDFDKMMAFYHDDIYFENWNGAYIKGIEALEKAWKPWFDNHGNFRFIEEETFIDEDLQKALYRWVLKWPSMEQGFKGQPETRRGVDVIHFKDGKIIKKLTYSKTAIEIDDKRISLGC